MGKSDVFFTDFRTKLGVSQTVKLQKLCRAAGIDKIDFDHKFVAIKMHFGELGNCSYLRPNYVKAVADVIKELGGIPFPHQRCGSFDQCGNERLQLRDDRLPCDHCRRPARHG